MHFYALIVVIFVIKLQFIQTAKLSTKQKNNQGNALDSSSNSQVCTNTFHLSDWWTYEWCDKLHVRQIHLSVPMVGKILTQHTLTYTPSMINEASTSSITNRGVISQKFIDTSQPCAVINASIHVYRSATVHLICCKSSNIGN